jgi:transporter family-2 protein
MPWIWRMLAVTAGVSFVFQQVVNANLRSEIGSPWWAGFISYLGGTIAILVVAMALREPWPPIQAIQRSHFISWSGGLFGAIYIAVSILLIPKLGTATVITLIVAGQMIGSLAFNQFGFLGVPLHQIGWSRMLGGCFIIFGVALVRQ